MDAGPLRLVLSLSIVALSVGPWVCAVPGDAGDADRPAPLILDDPPQPLAPKRPRTEAQQDRLQALALFAAARTHERRGELATAVRLYQRALRCDPNSVAIARKIPPLALSLGRPAEAIRYAVELARTAPPEAPLLRRLAQHLRQAGDLGRAIELYERAIAARVALEQTALDVSLKTEVGHLYYLAKQYREAADAFAEVSYALEHPDEFGLDDKTKERLLGSAGLTYNLFGDSFLRAGRFDEAAGAFKKAHQLAPNKALLRFNLARLLTRKGKPEKALAHLQASFHQRLSGEGMAPYELLAEVLEDLGRKEDLIGRLERLRAEDPKNVPLGYFLAGQYLKAERFDQAEAVYLDLAKETPTLTVYRSLAKIYRKTGRPDALLGVLGDVVEQTGLLDGLGTEAQAILSDADLVRSLIKTARRKHQDRPEDLTYAMCLGVALLALEGNQFQTASELFNLALQAKPDRPSDVFLVWGVGLLVEQRPAEAAEVFQRAIDQQALPDDDARFYYLLAGALAMNDQAEQALAAARAAIERDEDSPRLYSRAAWILYRAKRYDKAAEAYGELIEKFHADRSSSETRHLLREARLALSNLCVLQEKLGEAEEWLRQVLDEFPDDVGASNDLGYLWADQGKHLQRALRMIRHAVDAQPQNAAYRDSLGWVLYRLGRHREAVAELEKAVAADQRPDPVILDHLGDAYRKTNQPQKAKGAWRRAAEAFQKREQPEKAKEMEEKIQAGKGRTTKQ